RRRPVDPVVVGRAGIASEKTWQQESFNPSRDPSNARNGERIQVNQQIWRAPYLMLNEQDDSALRNCG
ncbi:MAG: hypothetical protein OXF56_15580, partial [Rhodobacteraceae bacterium]|nr:hypothetical protein [Paracoccaceae bacterium]